MSSLEPNPVKRMLLLHQNRPTHHRRGFEMQLRNAEESVVAIGSQIGNLVHPMTEAFLDGDAAAARELCAFDETVNVECAALEDAIIRLLALQAPVAGDLRRVVATLRVTSSLERSWALLRHVGESLAWVHPPSLSDKLRETIAQLAEVSQQIYLGGIKAWEDRDAYAANDLEDRDDQVDLLHKVLLTELYTGTQSVEESVSLALIARYYERIGDHGVDLAKQVAYVVTGQHADIRGHATVEHDTTSPATDEATPGAQDPDCPEAGEYEQKDGQA